MSTDDPPPSRPAPTPAHEVLHTETIGDGRRLVMAHGFTQTARVWGTLEQRLSADHQVVLVDMPGHAGSSAVAVDLVEGASLLAAAGGRASYLGYSMGARFCLHVALAHPAEVERLVLISGTAGIDDPAERRRRQRSDDALADELDPVEGQGTGTPVDAFVRRWLDRPMFADIGPGAGGLAERLRNTGPGLASSLRLAGTGSQQPRWRQLARLDMPVLVISGELDAKFTEAGRRMVEAIGPNAVHAVVAGTGHAPHLQRPGDVTELVRAHLARPARS